MRRPTIGRMVEMSGRTTKLLWRHWLGAAALLLALARSATATDFPYTAYVNTDDVYVRSGPGRNYYPTDKLPRGARVEVYRHDPGGWLAIRPPRTSFTWVSKRHLDADGNALATVNSDRVVARVGSSFSDVREVIQVRLEKGEQVELVAESPEDSPWCKIAPPAGEFRWVFSKYVDREPLADVASHDDQHGEDTALGDDAAGDRVRLASSESDAEAAGVRDHARSAAGTSAQPSLAVSSAVGSELLRLELELSAMVAQDVPAWTFTDLQRRAEAIVNQAETPVERGHARVLLGKLERFEDIRRRHQALKQAPADPTSTAAAATSAAAPLPASTAGSYAARDALAQFDGVGRLSPVISQKVGGPQYALVDNANAVISFVTPAPGVNLRPYVDHYVGVNGQRGYLTDLERQHISVQRVTVLDVNRQ
ncbi:MAG: SH3 domain-containing protein [Pirellulales bacterium]